MSTLLFGIHPRFSNGDLPSCKRIWQAGNFQIFKKKRINAEVSITCYQRIAIPTWGLPWFCCTSESVWRFCFNVTQKLNTWKETHDFIIILSRNVSSSNWIYFFVQELPKRQRRNHTQSFAFGSVEGEEVNKNFQAGGDPLTRTIPLIHLGDPNPCPISGSPVALLMIEICKTRSSWRWRTSLDSWNPKIRVLD